MAVFLNSKFSSVKLQGPMCCKKKKLEHILTCAPWVGFCVLFCKNLYRSALLQLRYFYMTCDVLVGEMSHDH